MEKKENWKSKNNEIIKEVNLKNVAYFDSPIGLLEIQSEQGEIISLHLVKRRGSRRTWKQY